MKNFTIVLLILVCAALVFAQAPAGSSVAFNSTGTCQAPAAGLTILCGTPTGAEMSVNGGAFASLQGVPGAAGPAGPAGAPGPAGTMPTSFACTTITVTSTGVSLSGCK
jgi:hypothetical protein